jgi:hypothetical protein
VDVNCFFGTKGKTMPRGPSQQIKKLDEERTKLLESAKADALARADEAINELTALGFDYELAEPVRETARKTRTVRKGLVPDHHPKGTCPICEYATKPRTTKDLINHSKRSGPLPPMN